MNKKVILSLSVLMVVLLVFWFAIKKDKIDLLAPTYDHELDSIFFNMYFGMSRQAFYDTCWKLNKHGLFIQGPNNLSVQHEINSELGMPVYMNFYPNFSGDDKLYQMPVMYNYQAWAPWNHELYSDSLIVQVVQKLERDFDVKMTKDSTEDGRPAYYHYEGPRKILVTTQDEQFVKVLIENEKYK